VLLVIGLVLGGWGVGWGIVDIVGEGDWADYYRVSLDGYRNI